MSRPPLTGRVTRAIAALVLALAGSWVSGSAAIAVTAATGQPPAGDPPVSLAITSVSPAYAKQGETVTVSGTLTNTSAAVMSGLSVQLRSSDTPFSSRALLQEYADGSYLADSPVPGAVTALPSTLAPRATVGWSVALKVSQVPMSAFGVYPLAAQADSSAVTGLTVSRTFLPFWPADQALDPQQQQIAWIWPLIDQPRQAVCAGLLNNGLAASVSSGGGLSGLLAAGSRYSDSAHLTWAIDPALLASVKTMTTPYRVGGEAGCGGVTHRASTAAASWLAQLKSATAGQPVFVTPFDDPDMAALIRSDMNADLSRAFAEGRSAAGKLLGRDFRPAAGASAVSAAAASGRNSSASLNGMAWLPDGIANYEVLEDLAASDGIDMVVLGSSTMPPSPPRNYTPSAQTTTPDGAGPPLKVLLSDDTITQIIGTANSPTDSKATAFSVQQRFLAETAMIAAEQPAVARSIVVAPPRRWDPPAGLASALLAETVSAPWLKPVSLGHLAAATHPTGQVSRLAPAAVSKAELGRPLLAQARQLDQQVRVLESIQPTPDPTLAGGVAAVESSAWRGRTGGQQASALLQQISRYLSAQEGKLTIIGPPRVTLTGLKGPVPVSISNGLDHPVRVRLAVDPGHGITVNKLPGVVTVPAGQQETIKLGVVAATVGSTTLRLRLVTPGGVPFPAQASVTIQATHYGTLALVIIIGALGVFVLTLAARALRRGRRPLRRGGPAAEPGDAPAGQQDPDSEPRGADQHHGLTAPDAADNVVARESANGHDAARAKDPDPARETDDYAWAPGRADRR